MFLIGAILTSSVYGFVVANRLTPTKWVWPDDKHKQSHNFLELPATKYYLDNDTNQAVDPEQKPADLFSNIIMAVTTKQQWVIDLCSGTGKFNYRYFL